MRIVVISMVLWGVLGCGVKGDPVSPTPAEISRAKATPVPEATPMLRKRPFPEYDQRNDQDDSDN